MIKKSLALKVLNEALQTGGDFAEIYFERNQSNVISLENGIVEVASTSVTNGVGIRILKDLQSVYGYSNDLKEKSLLELASSLAMSFSGERVKSVSALKNKKVKNISILNEPLSEVSKEDKIILLKSVDKTLKEYDERVIRRVVSFSDNHKDVVIYNSNGLIFKDFKERGRLGILAVASENGVIETSFEGPGASAGFEFFKNLDIVSIATNVAKNAVENLHAKECPSGKMPVIIGNGFGGVLFHEACGHSLEASSVAKNLSVFSNKLGEKIASKVVTAYDDGRIANGWGSNNIDDEGNKTSKTCLIKNGILVNYLIDDFNGRRMNAKGNGATRRQSYKYEPTSRMSNTYIAAGKSSLDEMLKATKLGLYAKSMGGGSVNPSTGEFQFAVSEGYIIRDGIICERVRGATLIGSGKEVLLNIDMVGNDLKRAQGMCGAASGSIPTDVGQPTLRIKEILVGGNGGDLR